MEVNVSDDYSRFFTVPIRRMAKGNSFSLLVCPRGGRVYIPWPGPDGGGYPKVPTPPGQTRLGGTPRYLFPPSRSGLGEGTPRYLSLHPGQGGGYPKVPTPHPGQGGGGVAQGTYSPPKSGRGRGYPKAAPPPPGQGLVARRAVCLLRSRRRTFL